VEQWLGLRLMLSNDDDDDDDDDLTRPKHVGVF